MLRSFGCSDLTHSADRCGKAGPAPGHKGDQPWGTQVTRPGSPERDRDHSLHRRVSPLGHKRTWYSHYTIFPPKHMCNRSVPAPQLNVVKTVLLLVLFHMPQSATPRLPKTNRKQGSGGTNSLPQNPRNRSLSSCGRCT